MFTLACSAHLAQKGRQISSLFLSTSMMLFLWAQYMLLAYGEQEIPISIDAANATNPLIYTRLRHDSGFLLVYRRFQEDLTMNEKRVTFEVNQTRANNEIAPIRYTYYENNRFEATSLTQDDIIFEALDQYYLNSLYPGFVFTYDNERDMAESSDPKLISRHRCNRELDFLMGQLNLIRGARLTGAETGIQLNNTLSMDVLALFDAFGTEEPGLLQGNYVWSGYWRQCKRSLIFNRDTMNPEDTLEFKSRYCIASIRSKRWDDIAASRIPELEKKRHFKRPEHRDDYSRFHRIQIGLCLPESCDSSVIDERGEDLRRLATHKLSEPLRSYKLLDLFCLPDESSKLRQVGPSGRLLLIFITAWLVIIISATVYDTRVGLNEKLKGPAKPTGFLEKMVDSMSFLRNFERLTETKSCQPKQVDHRAMNTNINQTIRDELILGTCQKPSINDLSFMNCIKVFTTLVVVIGHYCMVSKLLDRFKLDYDCIEPTTTFFLFSTALVVEYYFVIAGFITTYVAFVTKCVERNNFAAWIHTIVHRYLRLAPLYLLLVWFAKTIIKHTGSGPIWDYGTNNMTLRAICQRESFIYPLTLTSNFHPIHEECVMQSWYISADFQFHLITPFLLTLLHKAPSTGWLVSLGTIGASIALRFHRYLTDSRAKHLDLMRMRHDLPMRNDWDMHEPYLYPHYRISGYLMGVLAGHYTYMVLSGQWQSSLFYNRADPALGAQTKSSEAEARIKKRKDLLRFLVWLTSVTIMAIMSYAIGFIYYFPSALDPYVKYLASVTHSLYQSIVALGVSLFLITMMLGQFGSLKRAMSRPFWIIVSRVGFIIFLIHVELFFWFSLSGDRVNEMNILELTKGFIYICATIYPLSAILTILFELPIAQLERNFVAPLFRWSGGASRPMPTGRSDKATTGCTTHKQNSQQVTC